MTTTAPLKVPSQRCAACQRALTSWGCRNAPLRQIRTASAEKTRSFASMCTTTRAAKSDTALRPIWAPNRGPARPMTTPAVQMRSPIRRGVGNQHALCHIATQYPVTRVSHRSPMLPGRSQRPRTGQDAPPPMKTSGGSPPPPPMTTWDESPPNRTRVEHSRTPTTTTTKSPKSP